MADLVPVAAGAPSALSALTDPAGGPLLSRLGSAMGQPAVRRSLPWFAGVAAVGALALSWSMLAPQAQRTLYSELAESEKSQVVAALDKAGIDYALDPGSGALTVGEDDFYRARMLVAADGAVASPDTAADAAGSLPLGASRAMETDRLRAAREHELVLTIMAIDGVETARVHLAEAEKSVFVRDNSPSTASVMVTLARGRTLGDAQVAAIVNLVSASVAGLSPEAVRVVDQQGRLLTRPRNADNDRLDLQRSLEDKLNGQLAQLLSPIVGAQNFSTEIQVDLDMDEVTSARENYDKEGVVRSETQMQSQSAAAAAGGIPGATANTPPPATTAVPGPPQGGPATPAAGSGGGESSTARQYELGREVSVSNSRPGRVRRISVAVALSQAAMAKSKPADLEQIRQLVSAAVGADPRRGDQVAVVIRPFQTVTAEEVPIYDQPWFSLALRSVITLIGIVLVLLLAVRPLLALARRKGEASAAAATAEGGTEAAAALPGGMAATNIDPAVLSQQVELAQRLVAEQPDQALLALRRMLGDPPRADAA